MEKEKNLDNSFKYLNNDSKIYHIDKKSYVFSKIINLIISFVSSDIFSKGKTNKEINKLLILENLNGVSDLINSGYNLSAKQEDQYILILKKEVEKNGFNFLESKIKENIYIPNKYIEKELVSYSEKNKPSFIKDILNTNDYPATKSYLLNLLTSNKSFKFNIWMNEYSKYSKDLDKNIKEVEKFLSNMKKSNNVNSSRNVLSNLINISNIGAGRDKRLLVLNETLELLASDMGKEPFVNIILDLKPKVIKYRALLNKANNYLHALKEHTHHINFYKDIDKLVRNNVAFIKKEILSQKDKENAFNENNNSLIEDFLNKIKNIIENNVTKKDIVNKKDNSEIKELNINNLPIEIQDLLNTIKILGSDCIDNISYLNEEQCYRLNILIEKQPIKIINQYLSIDDEYREHKNLVNVENKTAKELTQESLLEIINILNEYKEDINNKKLKEISVTNRQTKAFKKD